MVRAGVGGAVAAPLPGMVSWSTKAGTNGVTGQLASGGLTNAVDRSAVTAGWDEDALVDTALKEQAYGVIGFTMTRDKFTPANMERVKAAVLAEWPPPLAVLDLATRFPIAERGDFQAAVEAAGAVRYANQPEYGRLMVKYAILRGLSICGPDVAEDELVRYLLAPECMSLGSTDKCKRAIKERAVTLARVKLRAEGKSFVVKDGVNPLVAKVQPVVDALNAPECAGLEAALRGLGSSVTNVDRKGMDDLVAAWQPKMMSGEMPPGDVSCILGKVSVALGPDGYNRFVDAYNNGTAGAQ